MPKISIGIVVLWLVFLVGRLPGFANPSQKVNIPTLSAFLIYDEDGSVDARDVTDAKIALWNTPIGEGDAGRPSSSILVRVTVTFQGKADVTHERAKLSLTVRSKKSGKVIMKDQANVPVPTSSRVVIPFVVHGTGCEPLELEAAVEGTKLVGTSAPRIIPFACGG